MKKQAEEAQQARRAHDEVIKSLEDHNRKLQEELIKKSEANQEKVDNQLRLLEEERNKATQELKKVLNEKTRDMQQQEARKMNAKMQEVVATKQQQLKKMAPQPLSAISLAVQDRENQENRSAPVGMLHGEVYANIIDFPPPRPPKQLGMNMKVSHTSAILPSQEVSEAERVKIEAALRAKIQAEQAEIQKQAAEEERAKIAEEKLCEIAEKAKIAKAERAKIAKDQKQAQDAAKQIAKCLESAEKTAKDALSAMRAMQAEHAMQQNIRKSSVMTPPSAMMAPRIVSQSPYADVSAMVVAETGSLATKKPYKPRGARGGAGTQRSRSQSRKRNE